MEQASDQQAQEPCNSTVVSSFARTDPSTEGDTENPGLLNA